jgi:hypothetical protein
MADVPDEVVDVRCVGGPHDGLELWIPGREAEEGRRLYDHYVAHREGEEWVAVYDDAKA